MSDKAPAVSFINRWMLVRAIILLASICRAPSVFLSMDGDFSEPATLWFVLAVIAFGFLSVCFLASITPSNSAVEEVDPRSWMGNPFSFEEPLTTLQFAAMVLIAAGISALIVGLLRAPRNWAGELPLVWGLGIWMGVRYCSPKLGRLE